MLDISKAIYIEDDYWNFGEDQAYVDYPIPFPTVTLALSPTGILDNLADAMRVEAGHLPMFSDDDSTEYDRDGWYNYYIGLNGWANSRVDNCIEAIVQSDSAEDDYNSYLIPLTEAEQLEVYMELDRQLRNRFGTSCAELLKEAEEYIGTKHKEGCNDYDE